MLQVRYDAPAGEVQLFVDSRKVPLDAGMALVPIRPNSEHCLMWIVKGHPGMPYAIEIVSPADASLKIEERIGPNRRGVGVRWFQSSIPMRDWVTSCIFS